MMRFEQPWFLVLVPVVLGVVIWRQRRPRPTVLYSSLEAVRGLPRTLAQRVRRVLPVLELVGLAMLGVAMARPQSGREDISMTSHGIAMQLVIDRSESISVIDLAARHRNLHISSIAVAATPMIMPHQSPAAPKPQVIPNSHAAGSPTIQKLKEISKGPLTSLSPRNAP